MLRQAIIWTNAGILLIGPYETNFSEILIGIQTFSFKKMHLKMSSAKWRPFCLGLNVLSVWGNVLWLVILIYSQVRGFMSFPGKYTWFNVIFTISYSVYENKWFQINHQIYQYYWYILQILCSQKMYFTAKSPTQTPSLLISFCY